MRRYRGLASVCAVLVLVLSLPAFAGSISNFSGVQLKGASGNVSGSFSFSSSNDQVSNLSLSFAGSTFGSVNVSDPSGLKGTKEGQDWLFVWSTKENGDTIWCSILFNPLTDQYQLGGWIDNWKNQGDFNYLQVPEGGTPLSFLMLSGLALFAGILVSGKRRRT